ncbi:MAG: hypothetical protein LBC20_11055 [Planctomycetaceae bacterium]|jgi:hypothetical protein|nr:hypothetical protein [Planctomycetaceae bacterium]
MIRRQLKKSILLVFFVLVNSMDFKPETGTNWSLTGTQTVQQNVRT